MTLNEIVYDVRNLGFGGLASDDHIISDEEIAHWVAVERALLIRQEMERQKQLNPILEQNLGCVEIECIDKAECCNVGLESEEYVYRTKKKIPTPIYMNYSSVSNPALITYIGLVTYDYPFEFTSNSIARWSKYKKFTGKMIRASFRNEYIYLVNVYPTLGLQYIGVSGVFEDPMKVSEFIDCSGQNCFSYDDEYPITPYLISALKQILLDKYLKFVISTKPNEDTKNDAKA